MSSLSRNSCAKAFGNWSRGKNFRLKKSGGVQQTPPASLRVKGKCNNSHRVLRKLYDSKCNNTCTDFRKFFCINVFVILSLRKVSLKAGHFGI